MREWTRAEVGVLVRAVGNAPSVHDTMPWVLETHGRVAEVYERIDRTLPYHDPTGRDRLISCGTALTNLILAVRSLGWLDRVELFPEVERPDLVARVTATTWSAATATELALYWAMFRRRSYRRPFTAEPVADSVVETVMKAGTAEGVTVHRVVAKQCPPLAGLLGYAADVLRADRAYQRELEAWTARYSRHVGTEDSIVAGTPEHDTLPWAGLVRATTSRPDAPTLARRLAGELIFVVTTAGDTDLDHLRAGIAMQRCWLAGVADGLAGAVITQPLHLDEVRMGLIDRLDLPGYPQLMLRLGYPATALRARQRDAREHLHRTPHEKATPR